MRTTDHAVVMPGWEATRSDLIAEVELTEEPPEGLRHDAAGVHAVSRLEDGRTFRVVVTEPGTGPSREPTLRDLREGLAAVYGTDFGAHDATWISRFTDATRHAAAYRAGRVLLAGDGHPLLGRRMPDLDLATADGPYRVFELLHDARPVLLNLGRPGAVEIAPWADRVRLVHASCAGERELPVLGPVTAPTAVLVRPDGYVAWVGERTQVGLREALTTWFGPPAAG